MDFGCGFKTPGQSASYRYLMLLDGVVAAFRSTWYMSTGCVILASGAFFDVRTQLLQPWVHYIPLRMGYEDFADILSLLSRHLEYGSWISRNVRRAGEFLTGNDNGNTFDKIYWGEVIRQYAQRVEVYDDLDPELFTGSTECDNWSKMPEFNLGGGQDNFCYGREFVCGGKLQDGYASNLQTRYLDWSNWSTARSRCQFKQFQYQGNGWCRDISGERLTVDFDGEHRIDERNDNRWYRAIRNGWFTTDVKSDRSSVLCERLCTGLESCLGYMLEDGRRCGIIKINLNPGKVITSVDGEKRNDCWSKIRKRPC